MKQPWIAIALAAGVALAGRCAAASSIPPSPSTDRDFPRPAAAPTSWRGLCSANSRNARPADREIDNRPGAGGAIRGRCGR